jgi:hypothetical protein
MHVRISGQFFVVHEVAALIASSLYFFASVRHFASSSVRPHLVSADDHDEQKLVPAALGATEAVAVSRQVARAVPLRTVAQSVEAKQLSVDITMSVRRCGKLPAFSF